MSIKPCPKCGNPDIADADSESAAEASWIECDYCEFRFQQRCCEETCVTRWNRLDRSSMPEFIGDEA